MYQERYCNCGQHSKYHGEQRVEIAGKHESDCGCHQHHGEMRFHRHFKSREEMIKVLKEYLEQLQAEAKGVEECIVEMEQTKESHQSE